MLIKALSDYYDILSSRGDVVAEGYSKIHISYMICLNSDGSIADIIDWKEEKVVIRKGESKTEWVSRDEIFPFREQTPAIFSYVVEQRGLYIFGLNFTADGLTPDDKTDKAKKAHKAFVFTNSAFFKDLSSPVIDAFKNFIINWEPQSEVNNEIIKKLGKGVESSFAFCLNGMPNLPLHKDPVLIKAWDELFSLKGSCGDEVSQCAVSGEKLPVARIHDKIKGIPGGQVCGCVFVGVNNDSESSYGKKQSYNSNISVKVMKKYTCALNYLCSEVSHKTFVDNITFVYWAQRANENKYHSLFNSLFLSDEQSPDADAVIDGFRKKLCGDLIPEKAMDVLKSVDVDTNFYIVGLKPNSSRLSLKFCFCKSFGDILENGALHQYDMSLSSMPKRIPLWRIINEIISPNIGINATDAALVVKVFYSMIYATAYPDGLLAAVVRRVKTDFNTDKNHFIKINSVRVGLIKAYINRKDRLSGKKEEISLALDTGNENPAYLCGRLFAVLEKIQQRAFMGNLNKTIKDSHFTAACTNPSIAFPKLMRISQNYLSRIDYSGYWNSEIGEIMKILNGQFPKTLSLTEQGTFIVGYYHQFYYKKELNSDGAYKKSL